MVKESDLDRLEEAIRQAVGPIERVDRAVSELFGTESEVGEVTQFTASVDACISLIGRVAPNWHWHVGHGPMGILPYASMSRTRGAARTKHVESTASTVPLALLGAMVKALKID